MADLEISCSDCGDTFPFRETEQAFYRERNLTPPKRCRACRDKRKTSAPGGAGADRGERGAGGPGGRARPGARPDARRGPGGSPARPGGSFAGGGAGPRGPRSPREDRPRPADPRDRKAPPREGAEASAARAAPAAPRAQWGRPQPAFARADGGDKPRPQRPGRVFDAAPPKRPARTAAEKDAADAPRPPRDPKNPRDGGRREAAAREDKPRFNITCQECGTQADVPFKPIDGRQIFCQPCYRARKGTAATATDGASIDTNDAGIIE
jgi:CxxC-x17-CxxC domain-containing protein